MKMIRLFSLIAVLAISTASAFAHGDKKHVVGTLEKVSAESVTVKTSDGKSVEVKLVSSTMVVTREGKPAKVSDLAPGERVVIHATPTGDSLSADEVKFSPASAPAASSKP
jgi:hypothetical protein